jgi:hypothetical protein
MYGENVLWQLRNFELYLLAVVYRQEADNVYDYPDSVIK